MVKYKLIQLYPGSKPLGYILKPVNNGLTKPDNYYQNGIWFNPSDYPEFWEEVVEKDYEILFVITNNNRFIEKVYNQDATIKPYWKIYSVKRLSDSEIFTIGDKVIGYNNSTAKIKTIDLVGEVSLNIGTDKHEGFSLKNLKKAKQPLLITADGVDIFEGDTVYEVKSNGKIKNKPLEWFPSIHHLNHINNNNNLSFSTREKAEEFILLNKPVLSLTDVWDNLKIKDQKEVMKFVKSKLK